MSKRSFISGLVRHQSAQALIEFSLVLPVMLIMLLGGLDLGRALVYGVSVQDGAREAARLGASGMATDADVLNRLLAASAPALGGCAANLTTDQVCGGGYWTLSIKVVTPSGTYNCIDSCGALSARTNCALPTCQLGGSEMWVTASGRVSMFNGISAWGMRLFQIGTQGQAVMVVL